MAEETLILTFQAQLSSVMETVLKTAMYEVTRLVEDSFLEEVRHSKQEVESLRTRLQWTEGRLKDTGGSRGGRCVDCGKAGEDLSDEEPQERLSGLQYSPLSRCGLKQEGGFEEEWGSCGQEELEAHQQAVKLTPTPSLIEESGFTEDDEEEEEEEKEEEEEEELKDTLGEVFKEEDLPKPPCAVNHQRGWALSHDGGIGSDSLSLSLSETRERLQQDCEELWNPGVKQNATPSVTHTYAEEDQRDTHAYAEEDQRDMSHADTPGFHSVDPELKQSALTHAEAAQNHNRESSKDYDGTKSTASPPWITCQLLDAHTDVHKAQSNTLLGRDALCSLESQGPRPQASDLGTVVIKQEIIVDSDVGEEEEGEEGLSSVMGPHSHYRVRPGTIRQNCITQGSPGQEVAKLLGARPKVDHLAIHTIPNPHQPIRKHPHMLPANASTAATVSASQVVNSHYRSPSTSKPAPPYPLQTVRPGDKRPGSAMFSRTSAQWVNVRAHQGSHPGRLLLRCNQCGKSFPHPSNLKAHQQTHTGERPFCCSLCGRSFTKLSNLKAHRRVHTGERPYSCTDCGKRFTQKCNLKRHQRIHTENDVTAF